MSDKNAPWSFHHQVPPLRLTDWHTTEVVDGGGLRITFDITLRVADCDDLPKQCASPIIARIKYLNTQYKSQLTHADGSAQRAKSRTPNRPSGSTQSWALSVFSRWRSSVDRRQRFYIAILYFVSVILFIILLYYCISIVSCYCGSVSAHLVLLLLINLIWFDLNIRSHPTSSSVVNSNNYVIVRPWSTVRYTSVASVSTVNCGLTNLIHNRLDVSIEAWTSQARTGEWVMRR